MDKFFDYIKKWGAVFTVVATVVGFFATFEGFDNKYLWWLIGGSLLLVSAIAFIWMIFANKGSVYNHISKEKISNRMGYQMSKTRKFCDSIHKYELIHRRDYLIKSSGSYFSIRHLKGKNVSRNPSTGITYYEGLETKDTFKNIIIKAIDTRSGKELNVINCADNDSPKFFLAFRIIFENLVMPQQEFDIVFSIFIKNELIILGSKNEFMSISLKRCLKGVENLKFDLAFDILPKHTSCFKENSLGEAVFLKKITVKDEGVITQDSDEFSILSKVWFQRGFKETKGGKIVVSEKTKTLNVYSLSCKSPQNTVFAINYLHT